MRHTLQVMTVTNTKTLTTFNQYIHDAIEVYQQLDKHSDAYQIYRDGLSYCLKNVKHHLDETKEIDTKRYQSLEVSQLKMLESLLVDVSDMSAQKPEHGM